MLEIKWRVENNKLYLEWWKTGSATLFATMDEVTGTLVWGAEKQFLEIIPDVSREAVLALVQYAQCDDTATDRVSDDIMKLFGQ